MAQFLDLGIVSTETTKKIFYTYSTLQMPLETSEMNTLGKILFPVNQYLAQIHLVAPGGHSKDRKAGGASPQLVQLRLVPDRGAQGA